MNLYKSKDIKKKQHQLHIIFSFCMLIIMYGYIFLTNYKVNNIVSVNDKFRTSVFLISIIFAIIFICKMLFRIKCLVIDLVILLYTIYSIFLLWIGDSYSTDNLILIIYLPLMYYCGRFVYHKIYNYKYMIELVNYIILICFVSNFIINRVMGGTVGLVNTIYYQLCILPQNLRAESKFIRTSSVILVTFCVFFSGKRTAFLIWTVCMIYFLVLLFSAYKRTIQEKFFVIIAIGIILLISILILDSYISNNYNMSVIERMFQLSSDGGSGRDRLLGIVINELKNNSFIEMLFGHNMKSTALFADGIGAHNDFVELFYRGGIIGILFVILILKKISFFILKTKEVNLKYYGSLICEIVIFFLLMMFSQIVFLASYNCFFAFELAMCIEIVCNNLKLN